MPLGIWTFQHQFLGWKDLWNFSSLYCDRWCNSQAIKCFDTEASISSLGWKDPGASKTLLWGGRCLWASGALNISFWGGRISGTPVPCIAMASAISWNGSTLELQYGFWGEWILELLISCPLWRKMPCASGVFNVKIWSGRISGTSSLRYWSGWCHFLSLGCLQTKWQLHNTSSLRTQDSKQLLHSHKKVIIILMKLAFSANKNNSYIVIGYNKNNKNYDNSNL